MRRKKEDLRVQGRLAGTAVQQNVRAGATFLIFLFSLKTSHGVFLYLMRSECNVKTYKLRVGRGMRVAGYRS